MTSETNNLTPTADDMARDAFPQIQNFASESNRGAASAWRLRPF